jgi:hypothetical protein
MGRAAVKGRVIVKADKVSEVTRSLGRLLKKEVLVGIPEDTTTREDDAGPVTNAALGYIHEFGAPGSNIPARPFLIPGVRKSVNQYLPHLKGAAAAALDGKDSRAQQELVAAGIAAEIGAKNEMHTGNFVPLKPSTIRARLRGRGAKSRRAGEERYLELVKQGISPADAQAAAGIRPLIDTGQLSNAITSVVREVDRG